MGFIQSDLGLAVRTRRQQLFGSSKLGATRGTRVPASRAASRPGFGVGARLLCASLRSQVATSWAASHTSALLCARDPVLVDLGPLHQVDVSSLLSIVATVAGVLVGLLIAFIISRQ
ncbi:hypothetical protein F1559_004682 [Cyanidiococcus yangmingshanensis]|uniref:Uncharacterized protein n=1 Tax=Cyanidiococcus yangmingshanensis TaxID=2690220 RepID=A0A7J7IJF2_9RHOD|nr:hypothetical protein F1559_004682 [Cyanidiococcus yangmingshanensis]